MIQIKRELFQRIFDLVGETPSRLSAEILVELKQIANNYNNQIINNRKEKNIEETK